MKTLSLFAGSWCLGILWYVFGAVTPVTTVSPSYASNIVHRVLAETNLNIGSSNLSSPVLIAFQSGVSNNGTVLGRIYFYGKDSNSVQKSYVEITATKQTGGTTNGAASLGFAVRGTNGTVSTLMLLDEYGRVSINKLSLLNLYLSGSGITLPLPTSIGPTNSALAIGTNELYWRPVP